MDWEPFRRELEAAPAFVADVAWTEVGAYRIGENRTVSVTIPLPEGERFYRLFKP